MFTGMLILLPPSRNGPVAFDEDTACRLDEEGYSRLVAIRCLAKALESSTFWSVDDNKLGSHAVENLCQLVVKIMQDVYPDNNQDPVKAKFFSESHCVDCVATALLSGISKWMAGPPPETLEPWLKPLIKLIEYLQEYVI